MLGALAAAEARALGRELDPEDVPYTRARLWDEPPVRAALDALWPFLTPQRLVAGLLAEEGALRRAAPCFFYRRTVRGAPPRQPRRVDRGGRSAARRGRSAARHRRHGGEDPAPGRRAGAPGRGEVRPGGARDHRPGRAGFRGRRHARRLEPRPGPAAHHGRTCLGRPFLGLRARDRGRGAGAVRDGLADGDAPDPDAVAHRGRRRGAARQRGRRPLLGADARPVRSRPLARGAAHGQLPHPRRDHGGGRRRAGRGRPRRAPARVRP